MTRRRQVTLFWLGALAAFLVVLFVFRDILLPFVAGMVLAYMLDPVADRLERLGLNRPTATAVILVLSLVVIAALALLVGPILIDQLVDLLHGLPANIEALQGLLASALDSDWARFLGVNAVDLRASLSGFMTTGADLLRGVAGSLWTGGLAVINLLSLFIVTPFVAFYVLRDWDRMVARIDSLLPRDHADEIRDLAHQIDRKVAAFVRGQMLSGLLLGIFYSAGLLIVGLNYGFLIGLAAGILSFIPYAGFTGGFVVSLIIALVQFWPEWIWIAAVIGVFIAGQLLEGYVLQPRLIGSMVGLHPVWLLFSLFAFGLLFGFVGLLVAIPAAAAVGVLLHHAVERYRASALFKGDDRPEEL